MGLNIIMVRSDYIAKRQKKKMRTYLVVPTFLVKRLHAISRNCSPSFSRILLNCVLTTWE
jgi:hypothetical protein